MPTNPKPRCSLVVPVYNEEANIPPFYAALTRVLDGLEFDAEIIFVDDGSTDQSYEVIGQLAGTDRRVKCLKFSRNFGSHAAITAGLRRAAGGFAVMISADLQDPPELIPQLIRLWRKGYHVVWAVREGRDDPFAKKLFAAIFYRLFRRIGLQDYPTHGMDFGLFDHRVLDTIRNLNEVNRFITAMVVWLGFRQAQVPYHRRARHSGQSKWSFGRRVKYAIDAIVSFSYVPIRFISYTGLAVSIISFIYAGILIFRRFVYGLGGAGWPSIMVTILFIGGLQLIMLGVLGEYIWRALEQVRGRPLYVVMDQIGFDDTRVESEVTG